MVAVIKPPITTVATGFCTSAVAMAIGMNHRLATNAVISTGRIRAWAPVITASLSEPAVQRILVINVTITSLFSTAIPASAIKPTPAEILNGIWRATSAGIPPYTAKGIPVHTRSA